jgi:hypothetical protein
MLAAGGALRVRWLDVEYLSDALVGDHLVVHSWLVDATALTADHDTPPHDARMLQTITRADGSAVMRAQSDWVWRGKPPVLGGVPVA